MRTRDAYCIGVYVNLNLSYSNKIDDLATLKNLTCMSTSYGVECARVCKHEHTLATQHNILLKKSTFSVQHSQLSKDYTHVSFKNVYYQPTSSYMLRSHTCTYQFHRSNSVEIYTLSALHRHFIRKYVYPPQLLHSIHRKLLLVL